MMLEFKPENELSPTLDKIIYIRVDAGMDLDLKKRAAKKKMKLRTYLRSLIKYALEVTK